MENRMNKSVVPLGIILSLFMMASSMLAHHSDSVFDQERMVTVTGTVTKFVFANPHTLIYLNVTDAKGNVVEWTITGGALGSMKKVGWTHNTIKPGEVLTINGFQYWDHRPIMIHVTLTRANGEEIPPSESEVRRLANFLERAGAKSIDTLPASHHVKIN